MNGDEIGKVIARLTACFPRPPMDPPTIGVWADHLAPKVFETSVAACRILERTHKRLPALADFLEAYDEARHTAGGKVLGKPVCGICDDGFVFVRCRACDCGPAFESTRRCPRYRDTVAKCPNGCVPADKDEREARRMAEEDRALGERDRNRQRAIDARIDRAAQQTLLRERPVDPSEPRERDQDRF